MVPSLDLAKVSQLGQMPSSTTNKNSGRLLLQSPSAANARNALEKAGTGVSPRDRQAEVVNKRELPNSEFHDFLATYDESMWQRPEEDKREEENAKTLDKGITDEIKEEEELSELSDDDADKEKPDSPLSNLGSERFTQVGEGDDTEDTFMPLDEALELESAFDINKLSKLEQRLKDVNRQPRKRSDLYPFRLQLLSKRVKKCKSCKKKILAPGDQSRVQMLMNTIVPKVTIYRIGKLEPGSPFVDLLLMIRNPNNSRAKVGF